MAAFRPPFVIIEREAGSPANWIIYQRGADAHDAAPAFLRLNLLNRELRDVKEAR
jgi:hypothetical protein